ncbi:hypothetical protein BJ165DRAFT_1482642 [Panaeolus papilionaceus]|nr:hypothetical protein BJ165DRAFT_1482642 [Panaeolus papilionaceus]
MNNNYNDSHRRSASPLPTWNTIHEPPSDDDSRDDDIDMLDRNSVAPSNSRPATARRSTVHGASSSNPGSTSMSTGNANSTTSEKTTAKTSSTMSGFLKRKDNASDPSQSQGNKRPNLQAGSGGAGAEASGGGSASTRTGTGAGSSKVQGLRRGRFFFFFMSFLRLINILSHLFLKSPI